MCIRDSREPLRWRVAPGALAVLRGDALVFAAGCASATLTRIAVRDGELHVSGTLSSPFFAGWGGGVELLLRRRPRKADRGGSADTLVLTEAVEGCPTATVRLGRSFQFSFARDLGESEDIWLELRLGGATIPLAWSVKVLARSAHALRNERIVGSWRVRTDLDGSKIVVDRLEAVSYTHLCGRAEARRRCSRSPAPRRGLSRCSRPGEPPRAGRSLDCAAAWEE